MRRRIATLTAIAAMFVIGLPAMQVDAQTTRGAASINGTAQNFTPIEKTACQGWGRWCGPGFVRACGPYRCWCRPCY
jgi:hypothetical protein